MIIDEGKGYNIVMDGMGRIDVEKGKFVMEGEKVGEMGEKIMESVENVEVGNGEKLI